MTFSVQERVAFFRYTTDGELFFKDWTLIQIKVFFIQKQFLGSLLSKLEDTHVQDQGELYLYMQVHRYMQQN